MQPIRRLALLPPSPQLARFGARVRRAEGRFHPQLGAGRRPRAVLLRQEDGLVQGSRIDLNLEPGKGSALAVQQVGAGANPIGLADMANALSLRGKGADTVGVFNVYANSPQGLYWLKSSGIKSVKDFVGKKIGNPPATARG